MHEARLAVLIVIALLAYGLLAIACARFLRVAADTWTATASEHPRPHLHQFTSDAGYAMDQDHVYLWCCVHGCHEYTKLPRRAV